VDIVILGAFAKLRIANISFYMSVCPCVRLSAWNNSPPTEIIFMKLGIWICFENLLRKFKFNENMISVTSALLEDQYTCVVISRSVLLQMRSVRANL